jgi:hypothetical protein
LGPRDLVTQFSQLAERPVRRKRNGQHRRAVIIEFLDDWRSCVIRQSPSEAGDAIANVLRRRFEVAIQLERSR